MNEYIITKLIKKIDELKDNEEDLQYIYDLKTIDSMINGTISINTYLVAEITNRYNNEFIYLVNLEKSLRNFQRIKNDNSSINYTNYLHNVRHSLIRVGIMRILKRLNKNLLEDDLINNDNENLYNKFIEKIDE